MRLKIQVLKTIYQKLDAKKMPCVSKNRIKTVGVKIL